MPAIATEDGALGAALRARGVFVGARLRARRGVATLLGVGHVRGNVWYVVDSSNDSESAWYWTPATLLDGLESGVIALLDVDARGTGPPPNLNPTSPGARLMHAWLRGAAGAVAGAAAGERGAERVAAESEGEGDGWSEGESAGVAAPSAATPVLATFDALQAAVSVDIVDIAAPSAAMSTFDALLRSAPAQQQWRRADDEALAAFADAKCDELGVAVGALRPSDFEAHASDAATPAASARAVFARFCEARALNELVACALPLVDFGERASHVTAAVVGARRTLFRETKQVSLLFTVTYYANRAHNLTRSP
jgi:hypothetical protein